MTTPTPPSSRRHATIDGLRGLAALAVMTHHFTMRTGEFMLFGSAQIAVDLFFCIGGFVIAQAYQDKILAGMTLRQFFTRRVLRFYPCYAIGMTLGLLALLLKYQQGLTDYDGFSLFKAALCNYFYIPYFAHFTVQFFDDKVQGVVFPLNGPAWSLFFSLVGSLFYFFALRAKRWLPLALCAFALLGFIAATKIYGESAGWSSSTFLGGFPRVIYTFFTGVLIYQARPSLYKWLPYLPPSLILTLIVAMLLVPSFPLHNYYWFFCAAVMVPLLVACASVSMAQWSNPRAANLAHYLAGLSYPVYCVHVPVFSLISTLFVATPYRTPVVFAGIIVCLGVAHLVYRFVEQPLMTRRIAQT